MKFYDRLMFETARDREAFLKIPIIQHAVANGASRELYRNFLTQAYHHVKHTFPLLALAASRTPDERYQNALFEYMREERGHEKWILDDIRAMGVDAEAARNERPSMPCQIMVGFTYYAIEHVSPYAMLGSVHVLEGMSLLLADRLADALQSSLAIEGAEGFSYLRSHGALDISHVDFFKTLINGFDDEATQTLVIENARIFYKLYGDIFRALGTEAEMAHAA